MIGPNPNVKHPIAMHPRVGFLKGLVNAPDIEIGDFTYYDDPDGPDKFAEKCVLQGLAGLQTVQDAVEPIEGNGKSDSRVIPLRSRRFLLSPRRQRDGHGPR